MKSMGTYSTSLYSYNSLHPSEEVFIKILEAGCSDLALLGSGTSAGPSEEEEEDICQWLKSESMLGNKGEFTVYVLVHP